MNAELFWLLLGFFGQFLFLCRFLIQWIVSEKEKKSIIPIVFWYFSIGGACLVLIYAIYRKDPVFILGQSLGIVIYARNLYLISQSRKSN